MFILNPYTNTSSANTIIGGVGSVITTKSALATKLGISESIIQGFQIIGSDIHCDISSNYTIPASAFIDDSTLTKYIDLDGNVWQINTSGIRNTGVTEVNFPALWDLRGYGIAYNPSLQIINLPLLTATTSQCLRNNTGCIEFHAPILETIGNISGGQNNFFDTYSSAELISMRKLKVYGNPSSGVSGNTSGFTNLKTNCTIEVHEDLATANAGSPHTSFLWAKTNRSAIVEFYDDAGNYVSTL